MKRQKVLVLLLSDSALDSRVDLRGRSTTGPPRSNTWPVMQENHRMRPVSPRCAMVGDCFRVAPLQPHVPGAEYTTAYLKYEYLVRAMGG